jgi:catechol 2,3-dioxygenase-like lactoylglutathione lyase family enzyme
MAITRGVHHVGLTVPDIEVTRDFFVEVLGFEQVGEKPAYPAVFVSDGVTMLTLWQVQDRSSARGFDRKQQVGLHHLALQVADADALEQAHATLATQPGVDIEFAPEPLGTGGARHMMCSIPGGVRLELIAVPSPAA